jgi:hypothetical protein
VDEKSLILEVMNIKDFRSFVKFHNPSLLPRYNWYKQQFLKYAQILRLKTDSIIIDGDTFPKSIEVLDTVIKYRGTISYTPVHQPYEDCLIRLLGPSRYYNVASNYITEAFFVEFGVLESMLDRIQTRTGVEWPRAILTNVDSLIGFSEYQTYARFEEDWTCGKKAYKKFSTTRNFGQFYLPGRKSVILATTDFVSFESYHYPQIPGARRFQLVKYLFFLLNKLNF